MNVLWITNLVFPEAQRLLFGEGDLKETGGWMLGSAHSLVRHGDVKLTVATVSDKVSSMRILDGEFIRYYLVPLGMGNTRINDEYGPYWLQVKEDVNPDVVHIHGTEYSHGLAYIKACGSSNVVISLQGMKSAIHYYYHYGLTTWNICRHITMRDIVRGTIFQEKRRFRLSGLYEIEMIRNVGHVIGRTSWDRDRTWAINDKVKYHFCNETLRDEFYDGSSWEYSSCDKHTIFVSQAAYPVKGLHMLFKALPLVLKNYPDTKVRVAGKDITGRSAGFKGRLLLTGYGAILKALIKENGLENVVSFIGNLNSQGMKLEYLKANVFVCPSTIENSPNSLGEAQILGTPVIASYVGGIPEMMKGDEEHLYRFDEIEMLARKICQVFEAKDQQVDMREVARRRHNPVVNNETLLSVYKAIINQHD